MGPKDGLQDRGECMTKGRRVESSHNTSGTI